MRPPPSSPALADAVMIRSLSQQVIDEFVAASTVPVISGMSCAEFRSDGFGSQEQHHPTQVIADLITMIERKPKGKQLSDLTFMWLGDGADGFDCVFMDHLSLFPRLGIRVICAAPKKYWPSDEMLAKCRAQAAEDGNGEIICTDDPLQYASETDFFYTGVVNYHKFGVSEEEAFQVFYPKYQINEELMAHAPKTAWVLHYLPGNRNWEMTDAVWDGPQSALLPLGENRLYAQRGILVYISGRCVAIRVRRLSTTIRARSKICSLLVSITTISNVPGGRPDRLPVRFGRPSHCASKEPFGVLLFLRFRLEASNASNHRIGIHASSRWILHAC